MSEKKLIFSLGHHDDERGVSELQDLEQQALSLYQTSDRPSGILYWSENAHLPLEAALQITKFQQEAFMPASHAIIQVMAYIDHGTFLSPNDARAVRDSQSETNSFEFQQMELIDRLETEAREKFLLLVEGNLPEDILSIIDETALKRIPDMEFDRFLSNFDKNNFEAALSAFKISVILRAEFTRKRDTRMIERLTQALKEPDLSLAVVRLGGVHTRVRHAVTKAMTPEWEVIKHGEHNHFFLPYEAIIRAVLFRGEAAVSDIFWQQCMIMARVSILNQQLDQLFGEPPFPYEAEGAILSSSARRFLDTQDKIDNFLKVIAETNLLEAMESSMTDGEEPDLDTTVKD